MTRPLLLLAGLLIVGGEANELHYACCASCKSANRGILGRNRQSLAGAVGRLFWLLWHGFVGFQLMDGCSPFDGEASAGLVRKDAAADAPGF
ncbi:hypothetical protein Nepgr_033074 [Nepenthes gracilis]|uniref:Secreted protein n=1 Tax=Nepenthes gracilis TaxID=150966 RepID=A0AAD3Y8R9_NEPGR|nr:hypothetical protein Nepgr_033074 [Nepenthes gracilis]